MPEFWLRLIAFYVVAIMATVFVVDQDGHGVTIVALLFSALPTMLAMVSWRATSILRFLRLVCGAAAASAGALLTLHLGVLLDPDASWTPAETRTSGAATAALIIAVAVGVAGTWAADLTVAHRAEAEARARDTRADARHIELLEQLALARLPAVQRAGGQPLRVGVRDLVLLAVAARLVRR